MLIAVMVRHYLGSLLQDLGRTTTSELRLSVPGLRLSAQSMKAMKASGQRVKWVKVSRRCGIEAYVLRLIGLSI